MKIRLLVMVVLVVPLLTLGPAPALGCSCPEPDTHRLIDDSPAVFVGTAMGVNRVSTSDPAGTEVAHRFEVEAWIKGDLGSMVDVRSAADTATCGLALTEGQRVGLAIYESGEHLASGLCNQTDPELLVAEAADYSPGPDAVPALTSGSRPPPTPEGSTLARVVFLGFVLAAATAGGAHLFRIRRTTT